MTAFDPTRLHELVDGPEQRPFVLELVATYRRMLQGRVDRVVDAVHASDLDDLDDATDAVLSLKVSSTMTGACELAGLATSLHSDLRDGDVPSARARAALLPAAAHRAEVAIDDYLAADPDHRATLETPQPRRS